jgi:hypothetical protein
MAKRGRWLDPTEVEVREMRDAESILGIIAGRCPVGIHKMRLTGQTGTRATGEPDDAKVSRPVRRGADGKGACK